MAFSHNATATPRAEGPRPVAAATERAVYSQFRVSADATERVSGRGEATASSKRLVITSEMLKRAYFECLERERKREWAHLNKTVQGRFWKNNVLRVDFCDNSEDGGGTDKSPYLSDNGRGADAIRSFDEPPKLHNLAWRMACINRVQHRLARNHPEALPVFWLILKNGKNRKASFAWLDEHWNEVMALKKQRKEASCRAKAKQKHTPRPSQQAAKGTAKSAVRSVPTSGNKPLLLVHDENN